MRAIQAQECADLPRFSLVAGGSPVLLVVVQGDGGFDDFGDRAFVLLCLNAQGIKGVFGQTDGEGGIFGGHLLHLHVSQMVSTPTRSANSR